MTNFFVNHPNNRKLLGLKGDENEKNNCFYAGVIWCFVKCSGIGKSAKTGEMQKLNNLQIAILVIEFQKTWTERSFFHWLIEKEYESRNVLQNTQQLLNVARKNGLTIIQSPFIFGHGHKPGQFEVGVKSFSPLLSFPGSAWECVHRGSASVFGYMQA